MQTFNHLDRFDHFDYFDRLLVVEAVLWENTNLSDCKQNKIFQSGLFPVLFVIRATGTDYDCM